MASLAPVVSAGSRSPNSGVDAISRMSSVVDDRSYCVFDSNKKKILSIIEKQPLEGQLYITAKITAHCLELIRGLGTIPTYPVVSLTYLPSLFEKSTFDLEGAVGFIITEENLSEIVRKLSKISDAQLAFTHFFDPSLS